MKPMNFGDLIEFNYFRTVDSPHVYFKTTEYKITTTHTCPPGYAKESGVKSYKTSSGTYNCRNLTTGASNYLDDSTQIFRLPNNMKDEFLAVKYVMLRDIEPGGIFTYANERYVKTADSESPSAGYCGVVLLDDTKGSGAFLEDKQDKHMRSGRFEEISATARVTYGD